jgi:ankyrin repeat protein
VTWRFFRVLNGSANFAHLLLRAVDATNDNRQTALQIAVESGRVEMCGLLILANANVSTVLSSLSPTRTRKSRS